MFRTSHDFGDENSSRFGEDLFLCFTFYVFGLYLICPREKNSGRASSPPMLLIGKNWGKICKLSPPNAQYKSAPLYETILFDL